VPAVEILALRAPEQIPAALREIFNGRPAVREDRLIEIKQVRRRGTIWSDNAAARLAL
jgi:hypothetical protein